MSDSDSSPDAGPVSVRPVTSIDELVRVERLIAEQFPPPHATRTHEQTVLETRFQEDRTLMLVAERDGEIVGGAIALRTGGGRQDRGNRSQAAARRVGIGRELVKAIEAEAIRLGAGAIYAGGANADNRGFYWQLGFSGRSSLMQKDLPLSRRLMLEQHRRDPRV